MTGRSQILALTAMLAAPAWATNAHGQAVDYANVQFTTQQIAPNFYTVTGSPKVDPGHPEAAGGRVGVLVTPDGIFMVDASYLPVAGKLLAAIRQISPAPIRFLVDTHEHPDHTGGNPAFAALGALIFAREGVYQGLAQIPPPAVLAAIGSAADYTNAARLPTVTYGLGDPVKIRMGGEIVDLLPLPAAHTDGDTMIRFEQADVIMIGDFYRNYGYPFIDQTNGGSFKGVLAALDTLTSIAGPNTKLVPGHGTVITRADLAPYRDMIVAVEGKVAAMIAAGASLQDVLAAKVTAPYDAKVAGGLDVLPAGLGTSADRFVGEVYAELKSAR